MNGLHPCPLPQRAPFAAVRRVSPLCAAFCPACECVRRSAAKPHVAPTCGQRGKTQVRNPEKPRRGGKNPPVREEPASHLASHRHAGSLPNAANRAEAHTHYFVTKSAARVTPCGRGHSTLRSLAPQFQTKPASLGFCLVEGNERYGGKMKKDKQFSIRISEQDLETIRRKAAQAHMSQSDYVTTCCLRKQIVILDGLKEVLRQQKAIPKSMSI